MRTTEPMLVEANRMRRDQSIMATAVVLGVIASAVVGLAISMGGAHAFGGAARGLAGARNPASLMFFVVPFAVCMAIGYAVRAAVRHLR